MKRHVVFCLTTALLVAVLTGLAMADPPANLELNQDQQPALPDWESGWGEPDVPSPVDGIIVLIRRLFAIEDETSVVVEDRNSVDITEDNANTYLDSSDGA